jgi:predicted Zn-dependent protease
MKSKIYRDLLLLLGVFFIAWLGFTYLKFQPTAPTVRMSVEDEEKIAEVLTDVIFSDMEEIESEAVNSALTVIAYRLTNSLDSQAYTYKFHAVHNSQVNAFATLGGHIYIFSGLIKMTESPEELAAVIAHEMGHVEERHVIDKMTREYGITLLISMLSGGDPSVLAEILDFSVTKVFSRHQEAEADYFGLHLLDNAGIQPKNMAEVFTKLKREVGMNSIPRFLQSHPDIDSRIANAMTYQSDSSFVEQPFEMDWEYVKAMIDR